MNIIRILTDRLVGGQNFTPITSTEGLVGKEKRHLQENQIFSFITKSSIFLGFKNYITSTCQSSRLFSVIDIYFK